MLRKAVYVLKDATRVEYETVVRIVTEMGGRRSILCPTLFVWKKRGRIIGIMVTHVDDFCFGGEEEFYRDIMVRMKEKLKIGEEKQ